MTDFKGLPAVHCKLATDSSWP